MKRFSITATAAIFAATLCAAPSLAEGAFVIVTGFAPMGNGGYQALNARVAYADLDIATPEGAAVLLARIDRASRIVCGERNGLMNNAVHSRDFSECRARASKDAVKAIGVPAFTQFASTR